MQILGRDIGSFKLTQRHTQSFEDDLNRDGDRDPRQRNQDTRAFLFLNKLNLGPVWRRGWGRDPRNARFVESGPAVAKRLRRVSFLFFVHWLELSHMAALAQGRLGNVVLCSIPLPDEVREATTFQKLSFPDSEDFNALSMPTTMARR